MSSDSDNSFDYLPYFAQGEVVKGFGRGGAELGIPTANFSNELVLKFPQDFVCGVYYGWACVNTLQPSNVYKMVMCVGWNTHFNNTVKTVETHIMHKFDQDFYHENLRIIILGYIRPMKAFKSLDELIEAMNGDIQHASDALDRPSLLEFSQHPVLTSSHIQESVISRLPSQQQSTSDRNGCVNNCSIMSSNKQPSSSSQNNGERLRQEHTTTTTSQTTSLEQQSNGENGFGLSGYRNGSVNSSNVIVNGSCKVKDKGASVSSIPNGHRV